MNKLFSLLLGAFLVIAGSVAAQTQAPTSDVIFAPDMILGEPDAPVTIIEYASYTCPHCARFHEEVFPLMKAEYIDTGKVQFIHREIYFDRYGLWAALLARCGDGTRYFGMNDMIYGTQRDWLGSGEPQDVVTNLRKMGRLAGMEDDQIVACMENKEVAQQLVATFQHFSEADQINATPTFVINDVKYSNMPYNEFQDIINAQIEASMTE